MMKVFNEPSINEWASILARPTIDAAQLHDKVNAIIKEVVVGGDDAIKKLTLQFDGISINELKVPVEKIAAAENLISAALKTAIQLAKVNIEIFHNSQIQKVERIETMPGVWCWRKSVGIEKVGIYIPGGSAPLFSTVLMLGVPAKMAGCKEIILCTPPNEQGDIHPAILYAASLVGVTAIYSVGGAQAIAAMAYGTQTIPKVDKIVGPGSAWVTAAKQIVAEDAAGAALDLPAGPSEVLVIADDAANPAFVAADLLAQAEHDPLSQAILLTTSRELAEAVRTSALAQLPKLSRRDILDQSLQRSRLIVVSDLATALRISNDYAPEHLILQLRDARQHLPAITSAGSIFLGAWSPEPMGDYCSGTNHVLPTYGYARAYSGLSVHDFLKRITVQELTPDGLRGLGPTASVLAGIEGLDAHALAVDLRLAAL